jgi:hypothetical protein
LDAGRITISKGRRIEAAVCWPEFVAVSGSIKKSGVIWCSPTGSQSREFSGRARVRVGEGEKPVGQDGSIFVKNAPLSGEEKNKAAGPAALA